MTLLSYAIVPPTDVVEASVSPEPDDISRVYIRIEVSAGNEDVQTSALSEIRFKITTAVVDETDPAKLKTALTRNPGSITPVAAEFGRWTISGPEAGGIFIARPNLPAEGEPLLAANQTLAFFLYDVEVVDRDGETEIKVTEIDADGNGLELSPALKIRKVFPALRIDSFQAAPFVTTRGQKVTLSWATTNASNIELRDAKGTLLFNDTTNAGWHDGSFDVFPETTATYTLKASSGNVDAVAIQQITVSVTDQGVVQRFIVGNDAFVQNVTPNAGDMVVQGTVTAATFNGDGAVPPGAILMWSGSVIPAGWVLCDGRGAVTGRDGSALQVPDLRNRFIVGSGHNYAIHNTGGLDSVTLTQGQMPSHNHGGRTSTDGSHLHGVPIDTGGGGDHGAFSFPIIWATEVLGRFGTISNVFAKHSGHTRNEGGHSHPVPSSGSSQAHENRPPYYALAYIMKL